MAHAPDSAPRPADAPEADAAADPAPAPAARVAVTRLKLASYRNYASLAVDFDARPVALTGANGAGKTNLMEAISFLSPGRGLRRAGLDEVARRPGDGTWAVAATVTRPEGEVDIGTGVAMTPEGPENRRTVRIEHAPARSADALLDHIRVLWLTPAMDGLFGGAAGDRRRFVDRAVLAIDPRHGARVNALERALRARNRLLSEPPFDPAYAAAIEAEVADIAVAVAAARRQWCDMTAALIAEGGHEGPFPAAEIALEGFIEEGLSGRPASELEAAYRERLAAERYRDAAAGRTLSGPHRSDLAVRHGPKDQPAASCSTGEQKALLIGLVLAQARLVTRLAGETPVVLLDEIAAHLDESRRHALFDILVDLGCQAFMTGTDAAVFAALGDRAQHVTVADGRVAVQAG